MPKDFIDLFLAVNTHRGTWRNIELVQEVKDFLWAEYDSQDELIYPNTDCWDDLLAETLEIGNYGALTKDEVLSILFGLIHRNRIIEGLWWSMFERGVTQKLLKRLVELNAKEFG